MTSPAKAYLETEDGQQLNCLFNPEELSISRTVTWNPSASVGENAPQLTFGKGESGTLGFTLEFDTTDTGQAVTSYTSALLKLMDIDSSKSRPPWVRFCWGDLTSFKSVLTSATITFTYFGSDGTPLRAKAVLSLKQYQDDGKYALQNPTSGTRTRDRLHRVLPGETLDRISYTYYGDPTQWRLIAKRNAILDPLRIPPGRLLIVPEREAVPRA